MRRINFWLYRKFKSVLTVAAVILTCVYLSMVVNFSNENSGSEANHIGLRNRTPNQGRDGAQESESMPAVSLSQSRQNASSRNLKLCPPDPVVSGQTSINETAPSWEKLAARHPDVLPGGRWRPKNCQARHRVAIIIPYRNREKQLRQFLQHMHPFLQNQNLDYGIYVAEQAGDGNFNRGLARNVGFLESGKLETSDCSVFHDVDLLPLYHQNLYGCPRTPRQLCVAVNYVHNFRPLYKGGRSMFGGVVSLKNKHFIEVNGYSNLYFGWGAEDDDLYRRVVAKGNEPLRYEGIIGRYQGLKHSAERLVVEKQQDVWEEKYKLLGVTKQRMAKDGLNSSTYKILNIEKRPLYTWIHFEVLEQERYEREVEEAVRQYYKLFGDLTALWYKLPFTPRPYWWNNKADIFKPYLQYRPTDAPQGS